jgi:hypothetical protein
MGFSYTRRYQLDLVLAERALWDAATWQQLLPALQPLFDGVSGSPGVRTVQYENGKRVRFGTLRWDAASHGRWTLPAESPRTFVSTEVWAPSWGRCERVGRPPDAYLHLLDRASVTGSFLPLVLLAVALDAEPARLVAADVAVQAVAESLGVIAQGRSERPWGRSAGGDAYSGAIADLGFSPNLVVS